MKIRVVVKTEDITKINQIIPGLYEFYVLLQNESGLPLDSPYVQNQHTLYSEVYDVDKFVLLIQLATGNYPLTGVVKVYANNQQDCCITSTPFSFTVEEGITPTFNAEPTGVSCVDGELQPGSLRLFNVSHATRFVVCYGTTAFNCDCTATTGTINLSGDTIIPLTPPPAGTSQNIVVGIYNGNGCDYGSFYGVELISPLCGEVVSTDAVILNSLSNGKVFSYEPSTAISTELFNAGTGSPDVAHTPNKLFLLNQATVSGTPVGRIEERNITLNPFSQTFVRNYDVPFPVYGAGMCAESDTVIYIAGYDVNQITLSGGVATVVKLFAIGGIFQCTGDIVYDPVSQLFLITYHMTTGPQYRIGIFRRNGTVVRYAETTVQNLFGIYQFEGVTYALKGNGEVYVLDLITLTLTPSSSIAGSFAGASQIPSKISIPS